MVEQKKYTNEFVSNLLLSLMKEDSKLFTYAFLRDELHISSKTIAKAKRGGDLPLSEYAEIFLLLMDASHAELDTTELLAVLKQAIHEKKDIFISVASAGKGGKAGVPEAWVRIGRWNGVRPV